MDLHQDSIILSINALGLQTTDSVSPRAVAYGLVLNEDGQVLVDGVGHMEARMVTRSTSSRVVAPSRILISPAVLRSCMPFDTASSLKRVECERRVMGPRIDSSTIMSS